MKPSGAVARRADYIVGHLAHAAAVRLVVAHHYARGAANTSVHCHGLLRVSDGRLVGAALWMPPTAAAAKARAKASLGSSDRHREVLVLSRLVVAPGEPQNAAGMLLGQSERLVRRDPRWALLVTYADQAQGHAGTIYKATNWTPDGLTKPEPRWADASGAQVSKVSTKSRTVAQMLAAGCVRLPPSSKLRFVKVLRK